jgi:hypothetical protein
VSRLSDKRVTEQSKGREKSIITFTSPEKMVQYGIIVCEK